MNSTLSLSQSVLLHVPCRFCGYDLFGAERSCPECGGNASCSRDPTRLLFSPAPFLVGLRISAVLWVLEVALMAGWLLLQPQSPTYAVTFRFVSQVPYASLAITYMLHTHRSAAETGFVGGLVLAISARIALITTPEATTVEAIGDLVLLVCTYGLWWCAMRRSDSLMGAGIVGLTLIVCLIGRLISGPPLVSALVHAAPLLNIGLSVIELISLVTVRPFVWIIVNRTITAQRFLFR
ncbi:MAG: hypothetical protein CHACPFDD_04196 [Phycisphaerae bacterium]|nr:hypothetical protein [Phycisphaerae bacterium]